MALTTEAVVTGQEQAEGSKDANVWIVDTEEAAKAVVEAGSCAVHVYVADGDKKFPIQDKWTTSRGTPDWSTVPLKNTDSRGNTLSTVTVYIAFSPLARSKAKTAAFHKEIAAELNALGNRTVDVSIPAGDTLESIARRDGGALTEEHLLERLEGMWDAIEEKASASTTIGDGAKDLMYDIAYADFDFRQSQGEPFITSKSGPKHIAVPFTDLNHYLVREYKDRYKTTATQKDRNAAIMTVEADCAAAPDSVLGVRTVVSPSTETQWIDLGRKDGKVVKLTPGGWSVHNAPDEDVFFRRTAAVKELPIPEECDLSDTKAALEDARRFANIPDSQWPLVVGWMVTHLIKDDDHLTPLIFFLGGSQSGKTTISVLTKFLTEGIIDKGNNTGARDGDLELSMSEERIKTLNNISGIPEELSELLCQVYEGVKVTGRKIYSSELQTLDIDCSVVANGITVGRMKEDLKTRVLALDVDPKHGGIPWRGGEVEKAKTMDKEMIRIHGQSLGALLTLATAAMTHHDGFFASVADPIFRLKGYATALRTLDTVWALNGASVSEYKRLMDVMSEEAVEDPMFECIRSLAIRNENYVEEQAAWVFEIDLATLKDKLNESGWSKAMDAIASGTKASHFATTNSVRDAITRKSTDWKRMSVFYENIGRKRVPGTDNKQTFYRFTFNNVEDAAWSKAPDALQAIKDQF